MVSFKSIIVYATAAIGVLGQPDPTGDADAAAAYWNGINNGAVTAGGDAPDKRDLVKVPRNSPAVMKDPYWGQYCLAPYTEPPCETKCNRNNCFRGFLNARDGSDGKHCPKEAFRVCCAWNHVSDFYKWWAIEFGIIFEIAPYAANCKGSGDSTWDVLDKINDVCGCTLNHEVTIDITSDYYKLRHYPCGDGHCY